MIPIRRFSGAILALIPVLLIFFGILGHENTTLADEDGDIGKRSAGTYLAIQDKGAQILQINKDGNLSLIFSGQFGGGALNDPFSDTLGSWKKTGKRQITATTVDITFENVTGKFVGVAPATYFIKFDKKFRLARVTCDGAIFPPGVDPFHPEAKPIPDSEFNCGEDGLEFHRLPAVGRGSQSEKWEKSLRERDD